jgi:hypothetical protein
MIQNGETLVKPRSRKLSDFPARAPPHEAGCGVPGIRRLPLARGQRLFGCIASVVGQGGAEVPVFGFGRQHPFVPSYQWRNLVTERRVPSQKVDIAAGLRR